MYRTLLVLAFVLLLLPGRLAFAQAVETCPEFDPAWQSCTSDADCVLGFDSCGKPFGIRGKSTAAVKQWAACREPGHGCPPGCWGENGRPSCLEGICSYSPLFNYCAPLKPSSGFGLQIILPWSLTLLITMAAYGVYRRRWPTRPKKHNWFICFAVLWPLLAAALGSLYDLVAPIHGPRSGYHRPLSEELGNAVTISGIWIGGWMFCGLPYLMLMKWVKRDAMRLAIAQGVFGLLAVLSVVAGALMVSRYY